MKGNKTLYYGLITILVNSLIIYFIFRPIIWEPDNYFFGSTGDGLKNYFTPLFYTKWNKGVWFTGMNYPFGDNVIFSDNQPILSWAIKFLQHIGLNVQPHVIGIMNILMLLSIVGAAYFLFLILSLLGVEGVYAMIFATAIGILSPQVDRITGHFALSYCCFIPMMWYFLLKSYKSGYLFGKYHLLLVLTGVTFSFIQLYYSLMFLLFIFLFAGIAWVMNRGEWKKHLTLLVLSLVPLAGDKLFTFFTDPSTDRLKNPFGFMHYIATWETVFLPLQNNFFNLNTSFGWFEYSWDYEGLSYVGLTGLAFVLVVLFIFVIRLSTLRFKKMLRWPIPSVLSYSLLAAIPILLFSLGYPFGWNMMWIAEKLSFLKQFRSMGRFAWVFYYIYSVAIAYVSYLLIRKLRISKFKIISAALAFSIFLGWGLDGLAHLMYKRYAMVRGGSAYQFTRDSSYQKIFSSVGKKAGDFQALLALPFFHVGSEKIYITNMQAGYEAMRIAYETGLPMIDESMSRTPLSNTSLVVQWIADSLIYKSVIDYLPSSKPILVVVTGNSLNTNENYLLSKSKMFFHGEFFTLYELHPADFKRRLADEAAKKKIKDFSYNPAVTMVIASTDSSSIVHLYDNLDFKMPDLKTWKAFSDSGVMKLHTANVASNDLSLYEYSAWIYIDDVHSGMPVVHCRQYDENNKKISDTEVRSSEKGNTYNNWMRVSDIYSITKGCRRVEIDCEGFNMLICNFINRRVTNNFIMLNNSTVKLYNNYPVYENIHFNEHPKP